MTDTLSVIEQVAFDLLTLVIGYIGKTRAAELLLQAARDQADILEDEKFPKAT